MRTTHAYSTCWGAGGERATSLLPAHRTLGLHPTPIGLCQQGAPSAGLLCRLATRVSASPSTTRRTVPSTFCAVLLRVCVPARLPHAVPSLYRPRVPSLTLTLNLGWGLVCII